MPGPKKYPSSKTIAKEVVKTLETLYPETPIPLDHSDPYTLTIAVLLSAQCTDDRVNKITPIFEPFPRCFSIKGKSSGVKITRISLIPANIKGDSG